jgi:ABC-type antimicrobial peptide transport system permease subunit
MALGSSRGRVLWLVLREALVLVVAGVLVGIPVAMLSSRLLSTMLYGVKGTDLISMALVISLLTIVAILAGLIPARRATRVDPMVALRYE